MADYSHQIDDLTTAASICVQHRITTQVNGVESSYPRWPEAWKACEVVWRAYLELQTMDPSDEEDHRFINDEAGRLR